MNSAITHVLIQGSISQRLRQISIIFNKSQLIMEANVLQPLQENDLDSHEDIEKQTDEVKVQRVYQFEKNYPKNIFIPIIEFLAGMGCQNLYEQSVGTRQLFQGKNVVSLTLIHQLLSENWFNENVNKRLLEANISNKILLNSKIKKKLFHLKVTSVLLYTNATEAKFYKKFVSKKANSIASHIIENDEVFQYPSTLIYLLNIFYQTLKNFLKNESQKQQENNDSEEKQHTQHSNANSKEQFKSLTKKIIDLLNKTRPTLAKLQDIEDFLSKSLMQRAKQLNQKFGLAENVPNWGDFINIVIRNCFDYKRKHLKITNSLLGQWVYEYKNRTYNIGIQPERQEMRCEGAEEGMISNMLKKFSPLILIPPPEV